MRAITIDSATHTIAEVDYTGDFTDIARFVAGERGIFTTGPDLGSGDCIFVDDEGYLKDPEVGFLCAGYPSPLAGNGYVLGCDETGASCGARISLDALRDMLTFIAFVDEPNGD